MLQALWYMDAIHCLFLIRLKFLSIILFTHERPAEHLACDSHCEQHTKKNLSLGSLYVKSIDTNKQIWDVSERDEAHPPLLSLSLPLLYTEMRESYERELGVHTLTLRESVKGSDRGIMADT